MPTCAARAGCDAAGDGKGIASGVCKAIDSASSAAMCSTTESS
eukprot:COSAG06_NODE_4042_length_4635_cov_277.524912_5_plen_42_part_01